MGGEKGVAREEFGEPLRKKERKKERERETGNLQNGLV